LQHYLLEVSEEGLLLYLDHRLVILTLRE